ncbi:MAG: UDP-N-acetylmuramoyl-L-alanine--D-glutamate ligase [Patescibacteria group bacterium]
MNKRSKIAILGFGVEGKALFEYLFGREYLNITICDQNVDLKAEMPEGISVRLGEDYLENLDDFEVIFRSPGIKFFDPHIQTAVQQGVEVNSTINFFMDQCLGTVIGVTGTKGKGTTSTLIYKMLEKSGKKPGIDVFLGGNIGQSPMEFLDKVKGDDVVVLELSSFQIQDLRKSPKYAVLLNTTSDHLDYHVDREEYLRAKEKILSSQKKDSVAVINKDYEYSKYYTPLVQGDLKLISRKEKVKNGAYVEDGGIFYAKKGKSEKIADVSEIKLVGSHNVENILPALVIAKEFGVSNEDISEVIREFKNLPYRMEFVREIHGVSFYNDSYSTTPETSVAAVDSFDKPTVLIAGGYDKGLDYNEWAAKLLSKESLHTIVLMGATTGKMEKALIDAENKMKPGEIFPKTILYRKSMESAVIDAYAESDEDGVVILSPAAASFDMYKNYKERGNEYIAHVRKLK